MTGHEIDPSMSYVDHEQLGKLLGVASVWFRENAGLSDEFDGTVYRFEIDGGVLAELLPDVSKAFPDVERIVCYLNDEDLPESDLGISIEFLPASIYDCRSIYLSCEDISLLPLCAKPMREDEYREAFAPGTPRALPHVHWALDNMFLMPERREQAGLNEVTVGEHAALDLIFSNLDRIALAQKAR